MALLPVMVQLKVMADSAGGTNFQELGHQLRAVRARCGESLAEASGAVEIDVKKLADYELGKNRPSQDILLLLISHFGVPDDEAVRLWQAAGYDQELATPTATKAEATETVLFTDVVDIVVNNFGVVMSFMQSTGRGAPLSTVAKVGMSREHAKSVLDVLRQTLERADAVVSQNQVQKHRPTNSEGS